MKGVLVEIYSSYIHANVMRSLLQVSRQVVEVEVDLHSPPFLRLLVQLLFVLAPVRLWTGDNESSEGEALTDHVWLLSGVQQGASWP